ncbi:Oxysterol-binding protein [Cryphonectria parasitica EP155]|uniref:Oxysterol-binding protein n=1 Tax=Cryphonectria parasitica (strain ATCC 38755 / EP155) TaxID=660469 RepID=A0A9P4YA33_CRYP1|nr:Oxysterol-binding protein [Cryphonectria parasitica EP155]KAF3769268.1 Oxysterol-binding protein [Cryphonectria parasitica EP155]
MADNVQPNPQATGSSWTSFLKSIASFNGDLSSLTAPPFILSGISLTEYSSYWCEHPAVFAAPAKEADPQKRAMLVLKWFLSTLKQQYATRSEKYGNEKKPLNPFLGELFLGTWEDDAGTTELISEQVSHHPPATAYSITNIPTGVHLEGYNAQKATFGKTINIKQIGHAILTVPTPSGDKETYLISLPSLHVENLFLGAPFIELNSASYITSSSGFTAKIDYAGKGWLSGKKNSFVATLYPTGREKEVLYNASGQWTKQFEIHSGPVKHNAAANLLESYDAVAAATTPLNVAPIEKQHPLESRRAWLKVAEAIQKGDMDTVGREKGKIENAQRELRAKEKAEGRMWQRRYFSVRIEPDPVLAQLGAVVGVPDHGDGDKTGGVWRFDRSKADKVRAEPPLGEEEQKVFARDFLGQ